MTTTSPASMGGPLSEAERPRNQHCMNCGDTRGGPMGHETSECTYDSSIITAVRGALKPSHRLVLGRLVHDAQQDTYPLADGSGGPYIVQGCVVNSAPQIQDAVRTIWKRVPTLLDELQAKRDEVKHLRTKAESLLTQNGVLVTEVRFQAERADGFREERDAATARVGVLEGQLATAQAELEQQRWYGEQLQMSIEGCSGKHADIQLDEEPEPLDLGHEFLPVNGHPDDDECTHRADGTDNTYCGEPKAAHGSALGLDGGDPDER